MKIIYLTAFVAGITFSINLMASTTISGKVKSINKSKSKVLVSSTGLQDIKKGDLLSLGNNCTLEVSKKTRTKLILDTDLCDNKSALSKGASVTFLLDDDEPAKDQVAPQVQRRIQKKRPSSRYNRPSRSQFGKISEGVRFGISTASLKAKGSRGGETSSTEKLDTELGFVIGYGDINMEDSGYLTNLAYTSFSDGDVSSLRAGLSATYGLSPIMFVYGGLNINTLNGSEVSSDPGLGYQLGLGFQPNRSFGINLNFVSMRNKLNAFGGSIDLEVSGFEIQMVGTF